ncbi:hypothetical protein BJ508DRAFT_321934 [Ascobolus immersus RN42]|uniref:Cyanovirin-N domain-containing protein n=1 Tax=Ascobolus immersus RN42 TaxID=1160509 RepID=A0A3N4IPV6_ASCIM|nr:hypothetical protein BJ508DRAFT_321934 [Ascobolus immersus RN42]
MKFTITAISILTAASTVMANGFIQCRNGSLNGGRGKIPTHKAIYSFDNGQTFICDSLVQNCGQMWGDGSWSKTYVNCLGNMGGSQRASFWITSDGCYNICSGGNHMWCCGAEKGGAGGGSCVTTGFGPGC